MGSMRIFLLADCPEFVPVCASWAYGQWGCQSGGSLERSLSRFSTAGRDTLPITLVAFFDGKPTGMASLWESDFSAKPQLSPWLASVFVHPFYRNRHVAAALVGRAEQEALRLGFDRCFLVTEEAEGLYSRCGWTVAEAVTTAYGPASLMTKNLRGNIGK